MSTNEPDWLAWARELQAIAQTGLAFSPNPYDRERYGALRNLAARMFAAPSGAPVDRIEALFAGETGYATPKVDVRAAVFDRKARLLMVRETADHGRWTLPGGWADVNRSAAENAAKEAAERERLRGAAAEARRAVGPPRQGHPSASFPASRRSSSASRSAAERRPASKPGRSAGSPSPTCLRTCRSAACCPGNSSACSRVGASRRCRPTSIERRRGVSRTRAFSYRGAASNR